MTIRINSEPVDITLEQEENLGEVISGIERWLAEESFCIRTISVDSEELDPEGYSQWKNRLVDEIEEIDIFALTPVELRAEKIQSLYDYFRTISESDDTQSELVANLLEEAPAVAELLGDVFSGDIAAEFLAEVKTSDKEDEPSRLSMFSQNLLPILEDRFVELSDPARILTTTLPRIQESISALADVSAYLQNGEDSKAMTKVVQFFELAQKLIRIGTALRERKIVDPNSLPIVRLADLSGLLSELSNAISDGDTITVGDLLEYEIGPRFSEIVSAYEGADIPA